MRLAFIKMQVFDTVGGTNTVNDLFSIIEENEKQITLSGLLPDEQTKAIVIPRKDILSLTYLT